MVYKVDTDRFQVNNSMLLEKADRCAVRRTMFLHIDGIALVPTVSALIERCIIETLQVEKSITLNSCSEKFQCNKAYLNVALRLLACQGWLAYEQKETDVLYKLTTKGERAFEITSIYQEVAEFIPTLATMENFLFGCSTLRSSDHWDRFTNKSHTFPTFEIDLLQDIQDQQFQQLVQKSQQRWNLPNPQDLEHEELLEQLRLHLDGCLIGPILIALTMQEVWQEFDRAKDGLELDSLAAHSNRLMLACDVLSAQGWLAKQGQRVYLTPVGKFAASKAFAYGVTVSYLPTFQKLRELLWGNPTAIWQRMPDGRETHVDRTVNVWASGCAHQAYFNKASQIILDLFNRPIDQQPLGIADMGCGDGSFLKILYFFIKEQTERGKVLDDHPLVLIGADYNQEAREVAQKNLAESNIPHYHLVFGDINDPDSFSETLWQDYEIRTQDLLHVRSFLDHNRPYKSPATLAKSNINRSRGAFAHRGRWISSAEIQQNLLEHFQRWVPYVTSFGILLLDLHTLPPDVVAENLGKCLTTAYDATHGYSDQFPIELPLFLDAAQKAGLVADPKYKVNIPSTDLAVVSINLLRPMSD